MKALILFLLSNVALADPSALVNAIQMDDAAKLQRLIVAGGYTVDSKIQSAGYAQAPLIALAARYNAEAVTKYLISEKANLNAKTEYDETAIMLAVFFNVSDEDTADRVARLLIDGGANLKNPGAWGPVAYGAYAGRTRIVEYLIQKGADVDENVINGESLYNTGLMMAAMQGNKDTLILLLNHDANVHVKNSRGDTALDLATKYNQDHLFAPLNCAMKLSSKEKFRDHCY